MELVVSAPIYRHGKCVAKQTTRTGDLLDRPARRSKIGNVDFPSESIVISLRDTREGAKSVGAFGSLVVHIASLEVALIHIDAGDAGTDDQRTLSVRRRVFERSSIREPGHCLNAIVHARVLRNRATIASNIDLISFTHSIEGD